MKDNWKFIIAILLVWVIYTVFGEYSDRLNQKNYENFIKEQFSLIEANKDSIFHKNSVNDLKIKSDEIYRGEIKVLFVDPYNHDYEVLIAYDKLMGYKIICSSCSKLYPSVGDSIFCSENFNCTLKKK